MPSTTVSSIQYYYSDLEPIAGCCRYVALHRARGLPISIDEHPGDSDVRDIRPAFILHSSTFFSVCGTWIYRLLLIFMHICHARHYSTLRNVHHRKRRRRSRVTVICYSVASVVVICLPVSLYGMYCGKTVYPRAKVTINSL